MTSLSKKPAVLAKTARKRGRPVGSKNKKKPAAKAKAFKQSVISNAKLIWLENKILELQQIRENLHNLIDNLEHKEIQYKAVISYLESKLEQR